MISYKVVGCMPIPGRHEEKFRLLGNLNQNTFVELVADILAVVKGHTHVKVVDGSGDGTRDIYSITRTGERSITQCKFHQDTSKNVGSRETNELAVALMKFSVRHGIFATTGRLSPQAHREFLDDYKGHEVEALQGTDIVDIILSNPVLAAVWFDGHTVTSVRHVVAVPFLIRSLLSDVPVSFDFTEQNSLIDAQVMMTIKDEAYPSNVFGPYREPVRPTLREGLGDTVHSCVALFQGVNVRHRLEDLHDLLLRFLKDECEKYGVKDIAVRFGKSYVTVLEGVESGSRIFRDDSALTFYRVQDNDFMYEKDWLLPSVRPEWNFSEDVRALQDVWARWHHSRYNTNFSLDVVSAPAQSMRGIHRMQIVHQREQWEHSFFVVGPRTDVEHFMKHLDEQFPQPETCNYGLDGEMMVWYLDAPSSTVEMTYGPDGSEKADDYRPFHGPEIEVISEFRDMVSRLSTFVRESKNLRQITPTLARFILACHVGHDQFAEPEEVRHGPVDLVFQPEIVPSPIRPQDRRLKFEQVWFTSNSVKEIRTVAAQLPEEISWFCDDASSEVGTYIFASVNLVENTTLSTVDLLSHHQSNAIFRLNEGFDLLRARMADIAVVTAAYWDTVIGLRFGPSAYQSVKPEP